MFEPHMRHPHRDDVPALWFAIRRGEVLVVERGGSIAIPEEPAFAGYPRHTLGSFRDLHVWGIDVDDNADAPDGHSWAPLRSLFGRIPDELWPIAGRAEQIIQWDRTHRFCGRCGEQTTPETGRAGERARKCLRCGLLAFPRLAPATITLVERGDEILLAWGRQFPGKFYSTLAGFVEPGESLEECVAREIREEVGIDVTDIQYFKSQPWPFPHSLMLGFTAKYAGGELVLQEDEIVDAGWFRADNLPPCPRGGMSIAGWLIESWLSRQGGT
jgi:NAD+ diphosphatase